MSSRTNSSDLARTAGLAAASSPIKTSMRSPAARSSCSFSCAILYLPLLTRCQRVERGRRMPVLDDPAVGEGHMHPAGEAGVEAPHRPHDVDALELVAPVLLE